jgi:hypothetical protein
MSDPLILIIGDDRPAAMEIRGALMQIGYRVPDQVYSGTESAAKAAASTRCVRSRKGLMCR